MKPEGTPTLHELGPVLELARRAGEAVLRFSGRAVGPPRVEYKSNRTPLTHVDRESRSIIVQVLATLTPGIPVVSEEGPLEAIPLP